MADIKTKGLPQFIQVSSLKMITVVKSKKEAKGNQNDDVRRGSRAKE